MCTLRPAYPLYYKSCDDDQWYVKVWDGSVSGPSHECVENMNGVVYIDSGVPREALFFMLQDSATCDDGVAPREIGLDSTGASDQAIVFAQLAN